MRVEVVQDILVVGFFYLNPLQEVAQHLNPESVLGVHLIKLEGVIMLQLLQAENEPLPERRKTHNRQVKSPEDSLLTGRRTVDILCGLVV